MLVARLLAIATAVLALAEAQILPSQYNGPNGLNDAAAALGKYMGTASDAYNYPSVASNGPYMTELKNKKDWGMITAANSMKPSSLQPNKGKFNYGPADQLVAMAKSMGAKMRCHTMLWHTQVPGWMNTGNNATMLQGLDDHIRAVMTHFGDICYAWDVVNEIVADNGGYRTSFWYNTAGASYIAHAFQTADKVRKELGLNVKLYYNDYGIEWDGSAKTKFALNMVKGLKDQGVPIDGVGLQSHFQTGGSPSKSALINIMNKYIALGVEVAVTELDEKLQSGPSASQQQQQSRDYAAVSGACAAVSKCVGVTIWDFNDEDSWIHGAPLPFHQAGGKGTTLERKLAYDGIMEGWASGGAGTVTPPTNQPTTTPSQTTKNPTTAPTTKPSSGGAAKWAQCGGNGFTGPTTCAEGTCVKLNDYYSQCQ